MDVNKEYAQLATHVYERPDAKSGVRDTLLLRHEIVSDTVSLPRRNVDV